MQSIRGGGDDHEDNRCVETCKQARVPRHRRRVIFSAAPLRIIPSFFSINGALALALTD